MDTLWIWTTTIILIICKKMAYAEDYNLLNPDGSFDFGYETPDSYQRTQGNRNNVVRGEFGSRSPETGGTDSVQYTAGPRGFRPRGRNIARRYDFNQAGPRPAGSADDPYFDPSEDPSYNFAFNTGVYNRQEAANRVGDVAGRYSYLDDIGERHNVEYIAGRDTGFHVKTPFPDSNPRAIGPLYFNGRGRPIPRGRTSIQRGIDGSYRFVSAGPDQRRTETSDSTGHVRGSYTYLDDKGVQHSVHYIAGPETGFQVLKNVKGPHLPTVFPFSRPDILPSDYYDYLAPGNIDVFDTSASGHTKPTPGGTRPTSQQDSTKKPNGFNNGVDITSFDGSTDKPISSGGFDSFESGRPSGTLPTQKPLGGRKPTPAYDDDGFDVFNEDLFGLQPKPSGVTSRPIRPPKPSYEDDGSYKPGVATIDASIFNDGGSKRPQYGAGSGSSDGTIVRNIGDRYFAIPPGATARAHVQAIDLLDVHGRALSPSDQLKAESSELDVDTSDIKEEYSTVSTTIRNKETTTVKNGTKTDTLPL